MSIEGYMSIKIKRWRTNLFSTKKAAIVSGSIVFFFLLSDLYLIFVEKFVVYGNETLCFFDTHIIDVFFTVKFTLDYNFEALLKA
jgi:hypothetical protein